MKSKRSAKERAAAVKRCMDGESIESVRKYYEVCRATIYNWIHEATESNAKRNRALEIGPRGVEQEERIGMKLELGRLREENHMLKDRLFRVMSKHNDWTA